MKIRTYPAPYTEGEMRQRLTDEAVQRHERFTEGFEVTPLRNRPAPPKGRLVVDKVVQSSVGPWTVYKWEDAP